jgi:hypothetical protein
MDELPGAIIIDTSGAVPRLHPQPVPQLAPSQVPLLDLATGQVTAWPASRSHPAKTCALPPQVFDDLSSFSAAMV